MKSLALSLSKISPEFLIDQNRFLPDLSYTPPIRFGGYQLGKRQQLLSNNYTHTWALAIFLATPEEIKTNIYENLQTVEQQDQFEEQDAQSLGNAEIVSSQSQVTHSADKTIISVLVKAG